MTRASLAPLVVATLGIGVLTVMDGLVKYVSIGYATPQVAMLRFAFGAIAAFAAFKLAGLPWPRGEAIRAHALRAITIVVTATAFFYALSVLPLAVALALSFTSPFFIALAAKMFLGEQPGRSVWIAVALGFGGVLVVLSGEISRSGPATLPGVAAAVLCSLTYAAAMVMLKVRAARDAIPTIVLLQNTLPAIFLAPAGIYVWTTPSGFSLALFAIIGMLGAIGHFALAWAYARADASRLGALDYTSFVWGVLIGLAAFSEIPSLATILGTTLIVGGALLVARTGREPDVEVGP